MPNCNLCATGQHGLLPTKSLKNKETPSWPGSEVRTLIDSLTLEAGKVQLKNPPLEGMDICWYRVTPDGPQEVPELAGHKEWTPGPEDAGRFRAKVSFHTPEVRQYDENFQALREIELG